MTLVFYLLAIAAAAVWAAWLVRAGLVAAQMYQIEEYETPRLIAWGQQAIWQRPRPLLIGVAITAGLGLLALLLPAPAPHVGMSIGLLIGAGELNALWKRLPAKKPIVYTPRMRRILGAGAAVLALLALGLAAALLALPPLVAVLVATAALFFAPALALRLPVIGNWLMVPVEKNIQQGFVRQAKTKIGQIKPRVVGIAGSYGKTSTKHIAAQLVGPQIVTLPTPKSYNTLMGITRTINENLEPKHQLFLVEMDAYAEGEIRSMCDLVHPEAAIITSVGPQHLERFGTVDRIGAAIYELVAALPKGGPVLIACSDEETAKLADRAVAEGFRLIRFGIEGDSVRPLDVIVRDLVVDPGATTFTWAWPSEQLEFKVSIPLLGKHNITNVSAGLALSHLLGLNVAAAVQVAARLEFVPHRLQLLPSSGGVTVIDDSYNANPVGVRNGLEVLKQMRGRKKILVTPGLVELGSLQESENQRYGELAAHACDHVILVGKAQTEPIQAGLRLGGFPSERTHVVQSLEEVTALLGRISGSGDVVLFANDLPDTYLEWK